MAAVTYGLDRVGEEFAALLAWPKNCGDTLRTGLGESDFGGTSAKDERMLRPRPVTSAAPSVVAKARSSCHCSASSTIRQPAHASR